MTNYGGETNKSDGLVMQRHCDDGRRQEIESRVETATTAEYGGGQGKRAMTHGERR